MKTSGIDISSGIPVEIQKNWRFLQSRNPHLQSPFFSPEFIEIIASSSGNVKLAILEEASKIVGLLPFERRRLGFAGPVGSFISDYQGIISEPNIRIDPKKLLRDCNLVALDFTHLLTIQDSFQEYHHEQNRSPIIDLTEGFESYVTERNRAGTEQLKKNGNLMRRLEREIGPLRFVAHSSDKNILDLVFQWKTEQFRKNRWRDIFSIQWVQESMRRIHAMQTPGFAGMLSAIYAGDRLIAVHFGMRSTSVWHYWFPAYDQRFAKYSPGVILLLEMAKFAPSQGIKIIDLGCGEHSYKWRLMNKYIPTASGAVELHSPATLVRNVWTPVANIPVQARNLIGKTAIGSWAKSLRNKT